MTYEGKSFAELGELRKLTNGNSPITVQVLVMLVTAVVYALNNIATAIREAQRP